MDLVIFHRGLFGNDVDSTPEALRVSPQQRRLYEAFPNVRGFSVSPKDEPDFTLFTATLVAALAQTQRGKTRTVFIFTPKHRYDWVSTHLRVLFRCLVQARRKDLQALSLIRDIAGQLVISSQFLQAGAEPAYWVTFGISRDAPGLPDWLREALIEVSDA